MANMRLGGGGQPVAACHTVISASAFPIIAQMASGLTKKSEKRRISIIVINQRQLRMVIASCDGASSLTEGRRAPDIMLLDWRGWRPPR